MSGFEALRLLGLLLSCALLVSTLSFNPAKGLPTGHLAEEAAAVTWHSYTYKIYTYIVDRWQATDGMLAVLRLSSSHAC